MKQRLMRMLREPLVHFLVLGAALFVLFGTINRQGDRVPGNIVVGQAQINHLATGFARTWRRPPTAKELEGLVRDYVREEVYYREAVALGLDRDDAVIRKRLHQKLEFVSEDVASLAEPTDADLRAFLLAHANKFRTDKRFTFSHVYLDPQRHQASISRDAADLLAKVKKAGTNVDLSAVGDSFLLADHFEEVARSEVATLFGDKFAVALDELALGEWQGPVESGYGVHLVHLSARTAFPEPALDDIRDNVRREWANAQRKQANEAFFQKLLNRYTVVVESPKLAEAQANPRAEVSR
jgi:hypothetical protein